MVDTPPPKVFILPIVFLAFYGVIVGFMPAELISASSEFRDTSYPEFYEGSEIEQLANFYIMNLSYSGGSYAETWGIDEGFGHSFYFITHDTGISGATWRMMNSHYYPFYFIVEIRTGVHWQDWVSKTSGQTFDSWITNVNFNNVSEVFDTGTFNMTHARFLVKCDHVTVHSTVYYNSTAWSNSTQAWENDDLHVEWAIEWDELGTGLNGWNLIATLLFFSAPDINVYVNFFIAFPMWVAIAYLIFNIIMVIISVLPFT